MLTCIETDFASTGNKSDCERAEKCVRTSHRIILRWGSKVRVVNEFSRFWLRKQLRLHLHDTVYTCCQVLQAIGSLLSAGWRTGTAQPVHGFLQLFKVQIGKGHVLLSHDSNVRLT